MYVLVVMAVRLVSYVLTSMFLLAYTSNVVCIKRKGRNVGKVG